MKKVLFPVLVVGALMLTSCSQRLVDFTTISTKNVTLPGIKKSEGVRVKASKTYIFGIGWNIKDGIDKALEQAGPNFDLLVDGVVRYSTFPFWSTIKVEGTAVESEKMSK